MELSLREAGFGYRAKYIAQTVEKLNALGGERWLESLRDIPYKEARFELMRLPGIGPKVMKFTIINFFVNFLLLNGYYIVLSLVWFGSDNSIYV